MAQRITDLEGLGICYVRRGRKKDKKAQKGKKIRNKKSEKIS